MAPSIQKRSNSLKRQDRERPGKSAGTSQQRLVFAVLMRNVLLCRCSHLRPSELFPGPQNGHLPPRVFSQEGALRRVPCCLSSQKSGALAGEA